MENKFPEFQVGDHVEVISREYGTAQFGMTGTITELPDPGSEYYHVEFDTPKAAAGGEGNSYQPRTIRLISSRIVEDTRSYLAAITGE